MALRQKTKPKTLVPGPVKGKKDPRFPHLLLVPASADPQQPYLPKLNPELNFMDATFYRFNPKTKSVETLVTVMPDGTHVAWWICFTCKQDVKWCKCTRGVVVCRSVEYIWDQDMAQIAGEDWNVSHLNYTGSLRKAYRSKHASRTGIVMDYRNRSTGGTERPKPSGLVPRDQKAGKTAQKPAQRLPGRSLKPKAKAPAPVKPEPAPKPQPVDLKKLDMGKLNSEAKSIADRLQDELAASLDNHTEKPAAKKAPLKKATVPAKKATTTKKTGGLRKKR